MKLPESWTKVTLPSKILAIILFALLPFIGFYLGIKYQFYYKYKEDKLKTFTHIVPEQLRLKSFKLTYPGSFNLKIGDTYISQDNYIDKSPSLGLEFFKNKSFMKIVSGAMGGEACLFPEDKDIEGPHTRYGEYKDIRNDGVGIWRWAILLNKFLEEEEHAIYKICFKANDQNGFGSITPVGGIYYKVYPGEEKVITEFDEIIKNIEVID